MRETPLVSVVMIFLNAERYMAEAIDSVFTQTYPAWELVLVDDGSTDLSPAIAGDIVSRYPDRARCVRHPGGVNRGMSASRNLGVANTRGQFIAFLDADDVWLPQKLAEQIAVFERFPYAGMVYGRTLIWHSWTGRPEDKDRDHVFDLGVTPGKLVDPPHLFPLLLKNQAQTPTTCNAIVRRDAFDTAGGFEEEFTGLYEDQVFFAKVELCEKVFVADALWARYRQHEESCSVRKAKSYREARRPYLEFLAGFLVKQGVKRDPVAWRALRREMLPYRFPRLYSVYRALRGFSRPTHG